MQAHSHKHAVHTPKINSKYLGDIWREREREGKHKTKQKSVLSSRLAAPALVGGLCMVPGDLSVNFCPEHSALTAILPSPQSLCALRQPSLSLGSQEPSGSLVQASPDPGYPEHSRFAQKQTGKEKPIDCQPPWW